MTHMTLDQVLNVDLPKAINNFRIARRIDRRTPNARVLRALLSSTINQLDEEYSVYEVQDDGHMTEGTKNAVFTGINLLATAVSNTAHTHGWWPEPPTFNGEYIGRNMGEMIALMHSELSEALESHRNSEPVLWYKHQEINGDALPQEHQYMRAIDGNLGKPEGLAAEFADCIIRILDTCHTLNIPVAQALLDKHEYNMTRPYRHGGKTC